MSKAKQPDPWDVDTQEPAGDIEAAKKIRTIWEAAVQVAANVRSGVGGPSERDRYECAAKAAMRTAMKIVDDLIRDAALRRIIELCVIADNLKTAETLLRAIQAVSIREAVLKDKEMTPGLVYWLPASLTAPNSAGAKINFIAGLR